VVLAIPLALVLCMVALAVGWRMLRSTGLEQVEQSLAVAADARARPPLLARVVDALGGRSHRTLLALYGNRRLERLDRRLVTAGRPEGLNAPAFVRRKAGFAVLGAVVAVFFLLAGQRLVAVLLLAVFALWMDLWLRQVLARRQAAIARGLPDFLDVLAVTVSAGLSLQGALERVSAADRSPLGEEVRHVLDDLRYGMSRRQALEGLRQRNEAATMGSFVTALLQAEELGTPISQALNDIAAEVRREFAQNARRQAAKAGPKVSLVVTSFIVPGAMLLIISSLVLSNLPKFRGMFG
jgi:tight adherence protein C